MSRSSKNDYDHTSQISSASQSLKDMCKKAVIDFSLKNKIKSHDGGMESADGHSDLPSECEIVKVVSNNVIDLTGPGSKVLSLDWIDDTYEGSTSHSRDEIIEIDEAEGLISQPHFSGTFANKFEVSQDSNKNNLTVSSTFSNSSVIENTWNNSPVNTNKIGKREMSKTLSDGNEERFLARLMPTADIVEPGGSIGEKNQSLMPIELDCAFQQMPADAREFLTSQRVKLDEFTKMTESRLKYSNLTSSLMNTNEKLTRNQAQKTLIDWKEKLIMLCPTHTTSLKKNKISPLSGVQDEFGTTSFGEEKNRMSYADDPSGLDTIESDQQYQSSRSAPILANILPQEACTFLFSQNITSINDFLDADFSSLTTKLMIAKRDFRKPCHDLLKKWRRQAKSKYKCLFSCFENIHIESKVPDSLGTFLAGEKVCSLDDFARMNIDSDSPLSLAVMRKWNVRTREDATRLLRQWQDDVRKKLRYHPSLESSKKQSQCSKNMTSSFHEKKQTSEELSKHVYLTRLDTILQKKDSSFLLQHNIITVADLKSVNKGENSPLVTAWLTEYNLEGSIARKSCAAMMKHWETEVTQSVTNNTKTNSFQMDESNTSLSSSLSMVSALPSDNDSRPSTPNDLSTSTNNESILTEYNDMSSSPTSTSYHSVNKRRRVRKKTVKFIDSLSRGEKSKYVKPMPESDNGIDNLFVMNEATFLCNTVIEEISKLPVKYISVYDDSETLYDFKVEVRKSLIPHSGMGAFLTFLGARKLTTKASKKSDTLIDSHVYYDVITKTPLTAKMLDGEYLSVTLTGKDIHGNGNSSFWLPHDLPTDGAILPCGKEISVTIKKFDFFDYSSLMDKENGIGFMGAHLETDYIPDNKILFSSYNDGCGLVDLGLYGPFKKSDRKTEHDFDVKDFIFCHEPCSWNFDVEAKLYGFNQIVDITDDATGEPHDEAKSNICMYVNEVGHSQDLIQNVLPRELGQSVHYYLHIRQPMRKGQTVELLGDYQAMYEKSRERKGYGLANINGQVAADDDEGTRLDRNIAERKEMEKYIHEMSEQELSYSLYFMITKIYDPVVDSLSKFTNDKQQKSINKTVPAQKPPPPMQWLARRRMEWLGNLYKKQLQVLKQKRYADENVVRNLLYILERKKLDCFSHLPTSDESIIFPNGNTLRTVIEREIFEELLHKSSRFLIRPFDTSIWCNLSQSLLRKTAKAIAGWKLSKHSDAYQSQKNLVDILFTEASKTVSQLKVVCDTLSKRRIHASLVDLSFTSSLLGKYVADASMEEIEINNITRGRTFGEVDIFNVPAHIAVAYKLKKGSKSLRLLVEQLKANNFYVVQCEDDKKRDFACSDELKTKTLSLDINWYILWQVLLVTHGLASQCVNWEHTEKIDETTGKMKRECVYTLEKLCLILNVNINDAVDMLSEIELSASEYESVRKGTNNYLMDLENVNSAPTSFESFSQSMQKSNKVRKRSSNHSLTQSSTTKLKRVSSVPKLNQNKIFWEIIWQMLTNLGWTLELGNRPNDFYFMPPGVQRGHNSKNRVDFFDSMLQVLNFIRTDAKWNNEESVKHNLLLYDDTMKILQEKRVNKNLPKDGTVEWLISEVKKERGEGIVYK